MKILQIYVFSLFYFLIIHSFRVIFCDPRNIKTRDLRKRSNIPPGSCGFRQTIPPHRSSITLSIGHNSVHRFCGELAGDRCFARRQSMTGFTTDTSRIVDGRRKRAKELIKALGWKYVVLFSHTLRVDPQERYLMVE